MENLDQMPGQPAKPNTSLPLAIIATVVGCCSPCCIGFIIGIVSIVFTTQVDSKYNAGDFQGAESSAKNARILAFVAIGFGILGLIISAIQIAIMGVDGFMNQYQDILNQYS